MASTDTRPGFRLPWSSDARAPHDETPDDAVLAEEDPAPTTVAADSTVAASAETPASAPAAWVAPTGATPGPTGSEPALDTPASRRPTKFLADLAKAMRSAAEAERQEILERFQAEAKAFVTAIHERSAIEAAELRAAADGDIAGIRDWSKAEIARIREGTERRIADRRARLEGEVDAHAARVERQIERVQGTIGTFEAQMARFFDTLIVEDDPISFAELASSLPEPPSLEDVARSQMDVEPTVAPEVPSVPEATTSQESIGQAEPAESAGGTEYVTTDAEAAAATGDESSTETIPATEEEAVEAPVEAVDAPVEAKPVEAEAEPVEAEAEPVEAEAVEGEAPLEAEAVEAEAPLEAEAVDAPAEPDAAPDGKPSEERPASVPSPHFDDDSLALDPRVAALGLTPDYDAAEAEAAAAVGAEMPDDGSAEMIPTLDEETIAARLAGLVPPAGATAESLETRIVVTGLVSVASIAGFKRGLARLPGVRSVSVSSGPEGEFVFAVGHSAAADLREAIATMPGFAARVTGTAEDTIAVVARDPDAAA